MLKIYRYGDKISSPCTLLLGGFDGLHFGHGTLLSHASELKHPVCITTLAGAKGGALFTQSEREQVFERAGIDCVYEISFTKEVQNTSAEEFLSKLFDDIFVQAAICGEDFRFGKDAAGTAQLLRLKAPCPVHVMPLAESGGEKIAASRLKAHLREGELAALNALLLVPYFIEGTVEHGRAVGRTYGFPTINLSISAEKLLPKEGVYIGYAETPKGSFPAIINFGARPTFEVAEKKIEAYLEGFSGDLYGETVRIYPTRYLRAIEKFPSAEALKEQLEKDKMSLKPAIK
ncbi:MAG: hypothetical protein IKD43_05105 [Clostridia bacterium]|nr:hypothetical protein [Clostridia bacterium]